MLNEYILYAGPMIENRLKEPDYGFEELIDYGWFGGISKILLTVLRVFHKGVKNWGLAIILLTILSVVTSPTHAKSLILRISSTVPLAEYRYSPEAYTVEQYPY